MAWAFEVVCFTSESFGGFEVGQLSADAMEVRDERMQQKLAWPGRVSLIPIHGFVDPRRPDCTLVRTPGLNTIHCPSIPRQKRLAGLKAEKETLFPLNASSASKSNPCKLETRVVTPWEGKSLRLRLNPTL